jgi:hypothetical protein
LFESSFTSLGLRGKWVSVKTTNTGLSIEFKVSGEN